MTTSRTHRVATAAYLRCYPYDDWQMAAHAHALEEHARRLGLGAPRLFLDNGVSSRTIQPELRRLLALAAVERIDTVLVPGRWVFSLDQRTADSVAEFLAAAGTQVLELPRRGRTRRPPQQRRVGIIQPQSGEEAPAYRTLP